MPRRRVPRGKFADDPLKPIDGYVVQELLNEKGLSRREVAKAIGVPPQTLHDVCNGQPRCRAKVLRALAEYFGERELVLQGRQGRELPPPEVIKRWEDLVHALELDAPIMQDLLLLPWTLVDLVDALGLDPFGAPMIGAVIRANERHFTAYADVLEASLEVLGRDRVRRALERRRAALAARFTC